MGDTNDDQSTAIEPGAAGAPEGAAAEPSADEIKELYDATGVKAPVPTGKPKGRPKANDGGNKKTPKKNDESGKPEKGRANDDGKDKSKTTPASDSDGADGDDADASSKKVGEKERKDGEKDSKVSGDNDEDAEGVSKTKSSDNGKTTKSGKDDDGEADGGAGEEDGESGAASEENKEGKRPGKSSPEVEKRMQRLAAERKEAIERAEKAEKKLQETTQKQEQERIKQEDPEYTVEDFRKVQDKDGNVIDLDPEKAELAWRRWKDGFDQRAATRQAEANREQTMAEAREKHTEELMKTSVEAYDALAALQDEYPELVSNSGKFDEDFAADAMPIIQEAIQYLEGTEPGNKEGKLPVIIGLKIDPKKILAALKSIREKKRNLPLNGTNDNVESGSSVSVPHSRSSDPTVNAANDLYKELGIKKRI